MQFPQTSHAAIQHFQYSAAPTVNFECDILLCCVGGAGGHCLAEPSTEVTRYVHRAVF